MHDDQIPPDPSVAAEPPSPAPESTTPSGPWAQDLEKTFSDPDVRGQVDEFMRTNYQPYVTRLEGEKNSLEQEATLLREFKADPVATFQAVTQELFPEQAAQIFDLLTPEQQHEIVQGGADEPEPLDPRVAEYVSWAEQKKAAEEQEAAKNWYDEQVAQLDVIPDLFHPLVISHGSLEAAYEAYPAHIESLKQAFGGGAPSPEEVPEAPATLGVDGGGGSVPPLEPKKPKSIDDAIESFIAQSQAPQTVGSI